MGALPNTKPREIKKSPGSDTQATRLDQYGRDPESPSEKLRTQTDYKSDTGYAPLYHAWMADIPRLCGGSAVARDLIMIVAGMSLGRARGPKEPRHEWTLPLKTDYLAAVCRCNVRDIQRQMDELAQRGVIAVKQPMRGQYSFSLKFRDWQSIEDYAVWKRAQLVVMDAQDDPEEEGDEEILPVSKDAVKVTKSPMAVRPGRASRAAKVSVGIRELSFQNESAVDTIFNAVVQSGRLVVSAKSLGEAKGEEKANAKRHGCRLDPPNGGKVKSEVTHLAADPIKRLFDPLLQKVGAKLLAIDQRALDEACAEVGEMPHEFLVHFVMSPKGRGSRPISGPKVVASIIREAREAWEQSSEGDAKQEEIAELMRNLGISAGPFSSPAKIAQTVRRYVDDPELTQEQQGWAKRLVELLS